MKHPYKVNIFNSIVLIGCGLGGFIGRYLALTDYQPTALIPFVLGVLLLVMTPGLKSENKIIIMVVVGLTLIFGIVISAMIVGELHGGNSNFRKITVFAIIAVSSFVSLILYLTQYRAHRKELKTKS